MPVQGCFWGVEHYFNKHFKEGILKSEVGYTGGETKDPNYRQVRRMMTYLAQPVGSLSDCVNGLARRYWLLCHATLTRHVFVSLA